MESIRTLIVDDEPWARRRIVQLLADVPGFALHGECRNGTEAVAALSGPDTGPDLVFLDVQMPDLTGVQVLQHAAAPLPLVVFVTAYDRYALQAFDAHAVDYLLKPIDPDRFASCLAHVRHLFGQRQASQRHQQMTALLQQWPLPAAAPTDPLPPPTSPPVEKLPGPYAEHFLVKQPGRLYFVPAEQVQYLEATGNYVTLHTQGAPHVLRTTLSQLGSQLNPAHFVRIHRSLVVNVAYIQELRPWAHGEYLITLHSGAHLTSSRSYSGGLQRFLQRFAS